MTTKQKILSYLKRCKSPKTPAQIARGTKCNRNTVRREVMELYSRTEIPICRDGGRYWYSYTVRWLNRV